MDIETIKAEVTSAVDAAASIGQVITPQYAGFIVLGQAVAKALPDLYEDVRKLISREAPTDDEVRALSQRIHELANPESI